MSSFETPSWNHTPDYLRSDTTPWNKQQATPWYKEYASPWNKENRNTDLSDFIDGFLPKNK